MFTQIDVTAVPMSAPGVNIAAVEIDGVTAAGADKIGSATQKSGLASQWHKFVLEAAGAQSSTAARGTEAPDHPAPPIAEQISHAILSRMDVAKSEGRIDVSLRLDPPDLGPVRVQITLTEQTLTARLIVHEESARQLVQGQIDGLKQRLAETGLSLGQFDVSGGSGRGQRHGRHQQSLPVFPDLAADARTQPTAAVAETTRAITAGIDVMV